MKTVNKGNERPPKRGVKRIIGKWLAFKLLLDTDWVCEFSDEGVRYGKDYNFLRSKNNQIVVRHHRLFAALTKAKYNINSPVDVGTLDFVTEVTAETAIKQHGGSPKSGNLEYVASGAILWVTIGAPAELKTKDLVTLMEEVGKTIGLSPMGGSEGMGTFTIIETEETCLETPTEAQKVSTRR